MQCQCGASTSSRSAVISKHAAELSYQECGSCTRVHIEHLKIDGEIRARGREAQEIFHGDLDAYIHTPSQGALF